MSALQPLRRTAPYSLRGRAADLEPALATNPVRTADADLEQFYRTREMRMRQLEHTLRISTEPRPPTTTSHRSNLSLGVTNRGVVGQVVVASDHYRVHAALTSNASETLGFVRVEASWGGPPKARSRVDVDTPIASFLAEANLQGTHRISTPQERFRSSSLLPRVRAWARQTIDGVAEQYGRRAAERVQTSIAEALESSGLFEVLRARAGSDFPIHARAFLDAL